MDQIIALIKNQASCADSQALSEVGSGAKHRMPNAKWLVKDVLVQFGQEGRFCDQLYQQIMVHLSDNSLMSINNILDSVQPNNSSLRGSSIYIFDN